MIPQSVTNELDVPRSFLPLFDKTNPFYNATHLTFYGGRAAAKSWQVARAILVRMLSEKQIVLCGREYQNSIADSVYSTIESQARMIGVHHLFSWQKTTIIAVNGSTCRFAGFGRNINSIKSFEDVKTLWIEEGQTISTYSLEVLLPTIRKSGSQIITTFNTGKPTDPIYKLLVTDHEPQNYLCLINYLNNPYVSAETLKRAEKMRRTDYERYLNIWLGEPSYRTDAQVLKGKFTVQSFDVPEGANGPYYGLDWGFSVDPCAGNEMWIHDNRLYITQEIHKVGVEVNDLDAFLGKLVDKKHTVRADNARPELISHLRRCGYQIKAADKWPGSVEDGISYLRSFDEIIIHPRCVHTINEANLWSYKTDKLTGDVLTDLVDANNHHMDDIRYAIQPLIRKPPMPSIRIA